MIPLPQYQGKTIAIVGLGKTGRAALEALHQAGAKLVLWDDTQGNCEVLPVSYASMVQHYDDWDWNSIDAVLLSPGIPLTHPAPHPVVALAQKHGVPITSDIELLYETQPDAIYITITGTNGKSTTTALVGHILKEAGREVQVGGNIGTAALAMHLLGAGDIYVLELSSYQLDLLKQTHFNVALLLNLSPDHLDRHGDMDGYIAAKKNIFARQQKDDVAIVGVDDAYSEAVAREMIAAKAQRMIPISTTQQSDKGIWVKGGVLHNPFDAADADLSNMQTLRGEHNHQNAAAAYAACYAVGLKHDEIISAMQSFPGLAHRMQKVGEKDGVVFVNDSKATNADAAAKSLGSYENIFWIAGGVAKAGGIEPLAPFFPRIKHAFLIGDAQDAFAQTLEGHVAYSKCESLDAATRAAYAAAKESQGVVLLAPACASFDQFANFEKRGEAFCDTVEQITSGA